MDILKKFKDVKLSSLFKNIKNDKYLEEHPLLNSKNIWNSKIAEMHYKFRLWQLITFISLFIALSSVAGIIHFGSKAKYIPYVVEVNKLGETVVIKPMEIGTVKDTRIIRAKVAEFINGLRVVTFDNTLQRDIVFRVYSSLRKGEPAINKVNQYYGNDNTNPFERSKEVTVAIQILSLVANTETTYQVDWNEKTYNKTGVLTEVKTYRSLVTIYLVETTNDNVDDLIKNPLGIYIRDFNISELKM